ncbi:hypothetical protein MP638_001611 [Amoeboaphelidium occidentale]|nr:hypothetical protein MP638_001611 [Amoeboaphelidium occidentale]
MLYHVSSLSRHGVKVNVVGYHGNSDLPQEMLQDDNITINYIKQLPRVPEHWPKLIFLLYAAFKILFQVMALYSILLISIPKPDYILIQNPPSIPTILIARITAWMMSSKLIIDWHNLGYSILALRLGPKSFVVSLAATYERYFGSFADLNICVTEAFRKFLMNEWKLKNIHVLYDKAPEHFKRLNDQEISVFRERLDSEYGVSLASQKQKKPFIIVTSTSWTEDEDMSLLFDAIADVDNAIKRSQDYPDILLVITGKGPQKAFYETRAKSMKLEKVHIKMLWLKIEDYPKLLGSADLGVSMHYSSSNLDLPMKVVDMFGCGLPVVAVNFECLHELVTHGVTGMVFETKEELSREILRLIKGFPDSELLAQLRKGVSSKFLKDTWNKNWDSTLWPLLENF